MGSAPARIYGLPKMHNTSTNYPAFRNLISSFGTINYNLGSFLGNLVNDVMPN